MLLYCAFVFQMAKGLTEIKIFFDSQCEKCPFLLGMNLKDFLKTPHSLDNIQIKLNPFA